MGTEQKTEREISRREATLERLIGLPEVPPLKNDPYGLYRLSVKDTPYIPIEVAEIKLKSGVRTVGYVAGACGRNLVFGNWLSKEGFIDSMRDAPFSEIEDYRTL
ncbi:MAG TPA: hypothetical protein VJ142_02665 [Candidatus Nanoarchaeia archaeon]|nr:hypothetical protein [Candidatus Nanoarchaeia archaeon]